MTVFSDIAVDLLWRIVSKPAPGGRILSHDLSSAGLEIISIPGESKTISESRWDLTSRRFFEQVEGLLGKGAGDDVILDDEIYEELTILGGELWMHFVPERIQRCLRDLGDAISSLLIVTDEPWIPWELVIPDSEKTPPFICCRYSMARWYPQEKGPRLDFEVDRILGVTPISVDGYSDLPFVRLEKSRLDQWIREIPGLEGEILGQPMRSQVVDRLKEGRFDLIHFSGHGIHVLEDSDKSRLILADRPLRAKDLHEGILRKMSEERPFVFLNACHAGRQGQALTGQGGWPDRWVRLGNCGALICPQWQIRDGAAARFSIALYERLQSGATLGKAVLEVRRELYAANPADPTPLAYSLYGHPNAVVHFGEKSPSIGEAAQARQSSSEKSGDLTSSSSDTVLMPPDRSVTDHDISGPRKPSLTEHLRARFAGSSRGCLYIIFLVVLMLIVAFGKIQSKLALYYNDVGYSYWINKKQNEASIYFQRAVWLDPDNELYLYNMANVQEQHDPGMAIRYYRDAVWFAPDFFPAHNNLARLLMFYYDDYELAIEHLEEAVRALEDEGKAQFSDLPYEIYKNRAWANLHLGNIKQASADALSAVELSPESSASHCVYAHVLEAEGRTCAEHEVLDSWRKCVAFRPGQEGQLSMSWTKTAKERLLDDKCLNSPG